MRSCLAAVVAATCLSTLAAAENFALIVVGSRGYMNYRHHADGCHAYKTLLSHGVPAKNIITMMYDDVANSDMNPFKGKLFNKPTDKGTPGVDVYDGCVIDYKGEDVTAENFISVLTGDSGAVSGAGNGRVLTSSSSDRVFVNFVDHGGPGLIAMPVGSYVYADKLVSAIQTMHTKKMYSELVFYVEACNSGSMFKTLPKDLNVYVTTAANAKEPSWGTYCAPYDMVDGKEINSCLGDLYSVNWMQDADKAKMGTETLEKQYKTVKKETNKSHVLQFGTLSIDSEPVGDFEAEDSSSAPVTFESRQARETSGEETLLKDASAVDSRDIALTTFMWNYMRAPMGSRRHEAYQVLLAELASREKADTLFEKIAAATGSNAIFSSMNEEVTNFDCLKRVNEEIERACGRFTDYSLKHTQVVVHLCESSRDVEAILSAVRATC